MAESISEGTLKTWLKQPGDTVAADEEVATIETDKVRSFFVHFACFVLRSFCCMASWGSSFVYDAHFVGWTINVGADIAHAHM